MRQDLENRRNDSGKGDQSQIDFIFENIQIRIRKAETHEEIAHQLENIDPQMDALVLALSPNRKNLVFGDMPDDVPLQHFFQLKSVQKQSQIQNNRQEVADQPKRKADSPVPSQPLTSARPTRP